MESGRVFIMSDKVDGGIGVLYWACREGVLSHVE